MLDLNYSPYLCIFLPVSCSPLMKKYWILSKHPCASSLPLRFPLYLILSASDTCMLTPLTSCYSVFLLNNQFFELADVTQTHTHTRTCTDAALRLDRYPSLFCWRRHWHHSWPYAKHTLILRKERETWRGWEPGTEAGRGYHSLSGNILVCSLSTRVYVYICVTHMSRTRL